MDSEARSILSVGAQLGEGPVWSAREQALWFVDIRAPCIYRFVPASGALRRWQAPSYVGWVFPAEDETLVAGLMKGLHRFDPADGSFRLLAEVETHLPRNRLNDAMVDSAGRIWFGSMDDDEANTSGHVYCWHKGVVTRTGVPPILITNGPATAPDGRMVYLVDTAGYSLDAHTVDEYGNLGPGRRLVTFDRAEGYPDGAICDAQGCIWVAFYGGWAARRYTPDGKLTAEVRFPVANVTKIALGGEDGRTAYVTTARQALSPEALAAQPMAGNIFTFRVDVPGVPLTPVPLGRRAPLA